MKRCFVVALAIGVASGVAASAVAAQVIPRLPTRQAPQRPAPRDTTHDSLAVKWPTPDSIAQGLLNKPNYSITRYQSDTAFFDAEHRVIDLLAAGKRRAVVDRDGQVVSSDSGIYYTQASHNIITGGNYVLSNPASGQADAKGHGIFSYDLNEKSGLFTNAYLPVDNGSIWYIYVHKALVVGDTTNAKQSVAYVGGGTMTSCDDSIPDYHIEFREAKKMGNTIAARPAILYLKDIPVMWLPFMFTDTRNGRHSGILAPQFGIGDIVRNSPTYRRNVEHAGYYWALNDYMGFGTWLDWRSAAGAVPGDPGWLKLNADWDYKWLDRFIDGRIGLSKTMQRDGLTNNAISWTHSQSFSHDSRLTTNVNWVSSTTLQRQNTFNPYSALATISSQASYQTKFGPASVSIGATQKQYPGRQQVDRSFPTLSITSTPIGRGDWFTWTPTFSYTRSDVLHMDQPGLGAYDFFLNPLGVRDSTPNTHRGSSQSAITFDTPIQIFGREFRNSFRINQQRNDFPQQFQIYDLETGAVTGTRIYAATYRTDVDWMPDIHLPSLFGQNRFNLSQSLSLQNVDPGPYWVADERTNGKYVSQSKRVTVGLAASPTLFALFSPGFGPFARIRHSITPQISYSYAPKSTVSDEYLLALGRTKFGYLGALQQNLLTFGLSQNFEAKLRASTDTAGAEGRKIQLLSINMTPLSYDFDRARHEHSAKRGLTTETWGYSLRSDLVPGFDFSSNYSLFQGSALSDTAVFKPVLTSVAASFSMGRDQNPLAVFARLFGRAAPAPAELGTTAPGQAQADAMQAQALAAQSVAGRSQAPSRYMIPSTQGWRATFSFSRSSPRAPVGSNVIDFDPTVRCQQIAGTNPFLLDACLASQRAQPTTDTPVTSLTAGGPAYKIPPTTSLNGNINFNLTDKWTAGWQTTYDFEHHEFASHIVSLQRDIHDWRAIFGFTQSPNGNFAFNFTISLKPEPEIKFDYNRATVRSGTFP